MRYALSMLLVLCATASFAAEGPPPPDAVDVMKAEYADHFNELPPMRKCVPEDVKGAWKEQAIYESAGADEVTAQHTHGPKYLAFGQYNTLFWHRSQTSLSGRTITQGARQTGLQYIATAAGMLYVYDNGTLMEPFLCFIATDATKKFAKDTLLLARPVEKDKSLTVTLYEPLK